MIPQNSLLKKSLFFSSPACVCVCDFKGGGVGVETTHKASNKSLFFPLVLSRESFPFPHKERREKNKRKKGVHMSIRVYGFNQTKRKKK
jgi:hypothetical protein